MPLVPRSWSNTCHTDADADASDADADADADDNRFHHPTNVKDSVSAVVEYSHQKSVDRWVDLIK